MTGLITGSWALGLEHVPELIQMATDEDLNMALQRAQRSGLRYMPGVRWGDFVRWKQLSHCSSSSIGWKRMIGCMRNSRRFWSDRARSPSRTRSPSGRPRIRILHGLARLGAIEEIAEEMARCQR